MIKILVLEIEFFEKQLIQPHISSHDRCYNIHKKLILFIIVYLQFLKINYFIEIYFIKNNTYKQH